MHFLCVRQACCTRGAFRGARVPLTAKSASARMQKNGHGLCRFPGRRLRSGEGTSRSCKACLRARRQSDDERTRAMMCCLCVRILPRVPCRRIGAVRRNFRQHGRSDGRTGGSCFGKGNAERGKRAGDAAERSAPDGSANGESVCRGRDSFEPFSREEQAPFVFCRSVFPGSPEERSSEPCYQHYFPRRSISFCIRRSPMRILFVRLSQSRASSFF